MGYLIQSPVFIQKEFKKVDLSNLVLRNVINKLFDIKQIEEVRESIHFNEDFHKTHKKFDALYNRGCGCSYCNALHMYTKAQVEVHRLEKRRDNYYDSNLRDSIHILRELTSIRARLTEYKELKDRLKKEINLSRL